MHLKWKTSSQADHAIICHSVGQMALANESIAIQWTGSVLTKCVFHFTIDSTIPSVRPEYDHACSTHTTTYK